MSQYYVTIASIGWEHKKIQEISDIFKNEINIDIDDKSIYQFSAESIEPTILICFTYVLQGLVANSLNTMSDILFSKIVDKIISITSKNKESTLQFRFKDEKQEFNFEISSNDPDTIKHASERIGNFLFTNTILKEKAFLFHNNEKDEWENLDDREIEFEVEGIIAIADYPVTKNGKTVILTMSDLNKLNDDKTSLPVNYEHKGRPIGKRLSSWIEGKKLYAKHGIFSDVDEDIKKQIKKGGLGLSLGLQG